EGVERARLRLGLAAPDGVLDVRREVLYAHRQPVEPQPSQPPKLGVRRDARVDFDGTLRVRGQPEVPRDDVVESFDLIDGEVRRRAATPVVLHNPASIAEM